MPNFNPVMVETEIQKDIQVVEEYVVFLQQSEKSSFEKESSFGCGCRGQGCGCNTDYGCCGNIIAGC